MIVFYSFGIWIFGFDCWCCLNGFRKCSYVEGNLLFGVGFDVLRVYIVFNFYFLIYVCILRCE